MRPGARAPFRGRALLCAVVAILAVTTPSFASAQRRSRTVSVSRARSTFESMESAWRELRALDVQPADANGAVAGWDRRWARRVARAERAAMRVCLDLLTDELGEPADCGLHERSALFCSVGFVVSTARRAIYDQIYQDPDLRDEFDARRAIADEAARRRAAGLSCEDLPSHLEIVGSAASGWVRYDGRPLVPPPPSDPSAVPEGGLSADAIRAVIDGERPSLVQCWEVAIRGMPAPPSVRLDVALSIGASGAVTSVAVSGDALGTLSDCVDRRVRRWRFPPAAARSGTGFAVAFDEAAGATIADRERSTAER